MGKKKNGSFVSEKEFHPFYVSDLEKTMYARIIKFYPDIYLKYCEKRDSTTSFTLQYCYGLEFFHECVKNLQPVLLGLTPFSLSKINEKEFLKNFTKKERHIIKKGLKLLKEAEHENKKEEEKLLENQTTLSKLLILNWQAFKDCASIASFLFMPNGLDLIIEAIKICRNINYEAKNNIA